MVGIEVESRRWKNGVKKEDLNISNEWWKKKVKDVAEEVDKIDWYSKIKVEVKESWDHHVGQIAGWQELSKEKEIRCESLPMCFLFFKIVLAILVSLHFHINLGSASISTKKKCFLRFC